MAYVAPKVSVAVPAVWNSSNVSTQILSYVGELGTHEVRLSSVHYFTTAEVCRPFQQYTRRVLLARWNEASKNEKARAIVLLQREVYHYNRSLFSPEQTPLLSQVSLCFARLVERQKVHCPSHQEAFARIQFEHRGSLALDRFIQTDGVVAEEQDENLMRFWRVVNERIQRVPLEFGTEKMRLDARDVSEPEQARTYMNLPANQAVLSRITFLDLSDNGLTEIPKEISLLRGLELEGLKIRGHNNTLRRIDPELVPYLALNMQTLFEEAEAANKRAPLHGFHDLEEAPYRLWFRQNCMPGETYRYIVECLASCAARVIGTLLTIPLGILYFLVITLPVFLLNHFTMYVVEPVISYFRDLFGYPPTVNLK